MRCSGTCHSWPCPVRFDRIVCWGDKSREWVITRRDALSRLLSSPRSPPLVSEAGLNEQDEEPLSHEWPVFCLLEPGVACQPGLRDGRSHIASLIHESGYIYVFLSRHVTFHYQLSCKLKGILGRIIDYVTKWTRVGGWLIIYFVIWSLNKMHSKLFLVWPV